MGERGSVRWRLDIGLDVDIYFDLRCFGTACSSSNASSSTAAAAAAAAAADAYLEHLLQQQRNRLAVGMMGQRPCHQERRGIHIRVYPRGHFPWGQQSLEDPASADRMSRGLDAIVVAARGTLIGCGTIHSAH